MGNAVILVGVHCPLQGGSYVATEYGINSHSIVNALSALILFFSNHVVGWYRGLYESFVNTMASALHYTYTYTYTYSVL